MRQKEISIDPANVDADGLAASQAGSSGTAVTMAGALISDGVYTADYARRIGVVSGGDDSGVTFAIVGTDPDGKALTESLTGSTGGTATTQAYFGSVSSVTPDGDTASTITVGTVDEFVTNTIPLDHYKPDPASISIEDITGTINISVEETFSRVQYASDTQWTDGPSALTEITEASHSDIDNHVSGVRLKCNSYTDGADLKLIITQNG